MSRFCWVRTKWKKKIQCKFSKGFPFTVEEKRVNSANNCNKMHFAITRGKFLERKKVIADSYAWRTTLQFFWSLVHSGFNYSRWRIVHIGIREHFAFAFGQKDQHWQCQMLQWVWWRCYDIRTVQKTLTNQYLHRIRWFFNDWSEFRLSGVDTLPLLNHSTNWFGLRCWLVSTNHFRR